MALVSVITPMYNAEKFISQSIKSVQSQTFTDWEMWVIDDCSSDNSYGTAMEMASLDSRIKVLKNEKNSGQAISRNMGVEKSTGRFICYLDADDLWKANKLEEQLNFMRAYDCALSFTSYEHILTDGMPTGKIIHAPAHIDYAGLLKSNVIGCLTIMYDTKLCGKLWAPPVMRENDYILWLSVLKRGLKASGINKVLAYYRTGHSSVSKKTK